MNTSEDRLIELLDKTNKNLDMLKSYNQKMVYIYVATVMIAVLFGITVLWWVLK